MRELKQDLLMDFELHETQQAQHQSKIEFLYLAALNIKMILFFPDYSTFFSVAKIPF